MVSVTDEMAGGESDVLYHYSNCRGPRVKPITELVDPEDNQSKQFFIFDELAVRSRGEYRLVCTLMDLTRQGEGLTDDFCRPHLGILDTLTTDRISVLSSRDYPGNIPMTNLTKKFVLQGGMNVGRRRKSFAKE